MATPWLNTFVFKRNRELKRNLEIKRNLRRALISVLFLLGTLGAADGAEPRAETAFGSNPGNLRMFSYVPADVAPTAPLIVVLHGCKQTAAAFARDAGWLALADRAKLALLLPEQKGLPSYLSWVPTFLLPLFGANNQNACFNWYEPDDTARDRGEALSIRQMIDAMFERHSLDRSRVYVVGLSAGGAMAAVMLAVYPERFAGGAVVAGIPYHCADDLSEAMQCMDPGVDLTPAEWRRRVREATGGEGRVPSVSIWHGDADMRVVPRNRRELVEQWTAVHGISATPARTERHGRITRDLFVDSAGVTQVESVLVQGFAHAFPIQPEGVPPCGQPSEYVVSADVCAAQEIARFWGLTDAH